MNVRSQLHARGSHGIRRLQGMPAVNRATARSAAAAMNLKPSMDQTHFDVGLELRPDAGLVEIAALAMRTLFGERCLVNLVDLVRFGPGRLLAIVRARFSARFFGVRLGPPLFTEGCRLTFTGSPSLLQRRSQIANLMFQRRDSSRLFGNDLLKLSAARTFARRSGIHGSDSLPVPRFPSRSVGGNGKQIPRFFSLYVTWKFDDSTDHTVSADDNSFASSPMANGQTFTHTFSTAGTVAYHCSIHPFMKVTIIVK